MKELKNRAKPQPNASRKKRIFSFTTVELQLLKKIGLCVHRELYQQNKTVDGLAIELGISRSTLREIIAGRSNPRLLTLNLIAEGLGHKSLVAFLCSVDEGPGSP